MRRRKMLSKWKMHKMRKAEEKAFAQAYSEDMIRKILSGGTVDVKALNRNSSYFITVEVGNASKDDVHKHCIVLTHMLHKQLRLKHYIVMPVRNGEPTLKFYDFKGEVELEYETKEAE